MRRVVVLLYVLFVLFCLCSCFSTMGVEDTEKNTTPTETMNVEKKDTITETNEDVWNTIITDTTIPDTTIPDTNIPNTTITDYPSQSNTYSQTTDKSKNVYSSYTYSSKYTDDVIVKEDPIIVVVNILDYKWERSFELELQRQFNERGINTYILTDYTQLGKISDEEYIDYLIDQPFVPDEIYPVWWLLEVSFQEGKTYEYGGGISEVEFSVLLYSLWDWSILEEMVVDVSGDYNNYENFNSSLKTVNELLSTEIVDEYCKYLRQTL